MSYTTDVKTVSEFIGTDNINADPAHQRPQIPDKNKRKSIITTMLDGYDIGEIKLNQFSSEPVELEVIDGSNRLRSIRQFYNNEFSINNKTYDELSSDEQDIFLNYPLRYIIYDNLSSQAKAKQFITTNTVTEVNHQEMLNAFGEAPIACLVREYVRTVPGTDTVPDSLFESTINRKQDKFNFRFFRIDNARLKLEDNVARIAYLCNKDEGLVAHSDKLIYGMYKNTKFSDQDIKSLDKKMKKVFTFVMKNANARNTWFNVGLSLLEFVCLYRLHFYLTEEYGSFHIEDYDEFFKAFKVGHDAFASNSPTRNAVVSQKNDKSDKLESDVYKDSLRKHEAICKDAIELLLEEFDVEKFMTILDNKRVFTIAEKETQLQRQDFTCWVDGEPLMMDEAEGGHIVSYITGGRSDVTTDNLRMMRRIHNRKMGSQNARKYKEKFLAEA
jgi:hypothetical protein